MVATIVNSLIYVKARRITQILPPPLRKLWKDWELRALVLLSLILQIILIIFGNRRKFINKAWLRILLWCSYLMADWVATVALGVLSNNLGDVEDVNVPLDPATQLNSFWAPFLLLHLGGPDTITAYAMEDNELWLRHFLGLGVQTGVALYIFTLAWTGSRLSILTIPMIIAGLVKYGERTWVLRSASSEQFRDSMITEPDPGPNYHKFMQEYTLKRFEGYFAQAQEMNDTEFPEYVSSVRNSSIPDADELIKADKLFNTFKRLFVDLILSFQDRDYSQTLFKGMETETAFRVVEIELGFMFDVLYTKAPITYTVHGCILRLITLSLTTIVLMLFSLFVADGYKFCKFDLVLTFLLLVVGILLELFAVFVVLSSDWTALYLSKHARSTIRKAISRLQLVKQPARWSNSLAQYSLLSFCLKTRPVICYGILKLFGIHKKVEGYQYKMYQKVSPELKELIFDHLKMELSVRSNQRSRTEKDKDRKDEPDGGKEFKDESSDDKGFKDNKNGDKGLKHQNTNKESKEKSTGDKDVKDKGGKNLKERSCEDKQMKEEVTADKDLNKKPSVKEQKERLNRGEVPRGINPMEEEFDHAYLKWSADKEFDQSILIWHIATDLCYHADSGESTTGSDLSKECKASKQLSEYMLYLLVMHPFMLPMGIGNIRYRDTCAEAMQFFQERYSIIGSKHRNTSLSQRTVTFMMGCLRKRKNMFNKAYACKMLLKVNAVVPPAKVKGDRSKSVLFDACRLASQLQDIQDKKVKWKMVSKVWVEILASAASQCRGTYHAQQLRRGGELLTHVWLLMAHLGLTEQFRISHGHARAKLMVQ